MASEGMEVDSDPKICISKSTAPTFNVELHPVVILSVADHWTRIRVQEGKVKPVFGAILGKKMLKNLEVLDSFEFAHFEVDGNIIIDKIFYQLKTSQYKEVFPDLEFLGWYAASVEDDTPDEMDADIHRQLVDICEPFLFMKVTYNPSYSDLPVAIYDTAEVVSGEVPAKFVKIPYTVVTEESERIGIDHIARIAHDVGQGSATTDNINTQYNAVRMLNDRLKLLIAYIEEVQQKNLPEDPTILRAIKTLICNLNKIKPTNHKRCFEEQCNDVMLVTYLASLTKGTNTVNRFVNKAREKPYGDTRSLSFR